MGITPSCGRGRVGREWVEVVGGGRFRRFLELAGRLGGRLWGCPRLVRWRGRGRLWWSLVLGSLSLSEESS